MRLGLRTRVQGFTRSLECVLNSRMGLDYHCESCGQWISTYHNSHKRHLSACKRKLKKAKDLPSRSRNVGFDSNMDLGHRSSPTTIESGLEPIATLRLPIFLKMVFVSF